MNPVINLVKTFNEDVMLSCIDGGFRKVLQSFENDFVEFDIENVNENITFKFSVEDMGETVEIIISGFGKALVTFTMCKSHIVKVSQCRQGYGSLVKSISKHLIHSLKTLAMMCLKTNKTPVELAMMCSCPFH